MIKSYGGLYRYGLRVRSLEDSISYIKMTTAVKATVFLQFLINISNYNVRIVQGAGEFRVHTVINE